MAGFHWEASDDDIKEVANRKRAVSCGPRVAAAFRGALVVGSPRQGQRHHDPLSPEGKYRGQTPAEVL